MLRIVIFAIASIFVFSISYSLSDPFSQRDWKIFYRNTEIQGADVSTFIKIDELYWRDKNAVYRGAGKISKIDVHSFERLRWLYSRDKNYVWRAWEREIPWIDPVSLTFIDDPDVWKSDFPDFQKRNTWLIDMFRRWNEDPRMVSLWFGYVELDEFLYYRWEKLDNITIDEFTHTFPGILTYNDFLLVNGKVTSISALDLDVYYEEYVPWLWLPFWLSDNKFVFLKRTQYDRLIAIPLPKYQDTIDDIVRNEIAPKLTSTQFEKLLIASWANSNDDAIRYEYLFWSERDLLFWAVRNYLYTNRSKYYNPTWQEKR